jgi:O-antigen ligase
VRLFPVSVVLLLAWGALAMGGYPSWAAAPVAVFAVTTGLLGFLERRESASTTRATPKLPHRSVIFALCLFLAAVGVQLVPIPASTAARLSPSRDVAQFERLLATADRRDPELVPVVAEGAPRPLSIAPGRTWWGLGFAAAFAFYLIGASYGLSAVGISRATGRVIALGVFVAFLGIYQRASDTAVVYGWYVPLVPSRSAPFVNRNHQAGWLVMALSLTLGMFAGDVARGMRGVAARWRERVIWFSTKEASVAIMLLFAAVIMAIGILTTQSRSGASALLLALSAIALLSSRRQSSNARRRIVAVSLVAVALIAFFTSGSAVMARFAAIDWISGSGRLAVWQDSMAVIDNFWLTGTGFNTFGVSMLHYQTVSNGFRSIEAHNDYLQLAVEGGWLLGVPLLILFASLALEIRRRFREGADDTRTYWVRVGAVTGLLAMAFQALVDFTLQMPGGAVMFATLLAIAIHHPRPTMANRERHAE